MSALKLNTLLIKNKDVAGSLFYEQTFVLKICKVIKFLSTTAATLFCKASVVYKIQI